MASSTLSWSSSTIFHNFIIPHTSEAKAISNKPTSMLIKAQKKTKKVRKTSAPTGHPLRNLSLSFVQPSPVFREITALTRRTFAHPLGPDIYSLLLIWIILKEDVQDLGKKGQLVDVKAGYFRNFLFPMGKAQIVTPILLKEMRMEEERIEAEKQRVKEEAQQLARMFETVGAFKVKRQGGKGKQIFGTVTAQDLADIIKAQLQRDVDKRMIELPEIREVGEYIAELKLHPEVSARIRVTVYAK